MLIASNENISILCSKNGYDLTLVDSKRGTRWVLDKKTLAYGEELKQLIPFHAEIEGNARLVISYKAGSIILKLIYELKNEYVEIRMPVPVGNLGRISFPGSFFPEGEKMKLILPIMQGMLWNGQGEPFFRFYGEAAHMGFSMPLVGYMAQSGGLLFTAETQDDVQWWTGKDETGRIWACNLQVNSLGSMRYDRVARLYVTGADIVAIAKTYRKKIKEQGRFKSWEEKIAKRPGLERLFGALMCFIGYCQDDIDYPAGCRKLRDYGFDRALVYPGRFNIYFPDIRMGDRPAINLSTEAVEGIKALGYDVAPWSWLNEALDDGSDTIHSMYRKNNKGKIIPNWSIDKQQWYLICSTFLEKVQKSALENVIADMTWDHFDVLACASVGECHATDHPNHFGYPVSKTEDREWIRKALLAGQKHGRAISSENFNDAYSLECDFGSVKAWPQYSHWPFWPIPLTMLVYHDSIIHSWWELHSYNNGWRGRTKSPGFFEYGGGRPKLMSALDALYGCPPDVFPFGAQYGYTGRGMETFLYKFRMEDPEVQIALREALPVARLHKKIGRLEMVHFKFLSEDGYLQETAFADGTRVVANFSRDFYGAEPGVDHVEAPGIDCLAPESWKSFE